MPTMEPAEGAIFPIETIQAEIVHIVQDEDHTKAWCSGETYIPSGTAKVYKLCPHCHNKFRNDFREGS